MKALKFNLNDPAIQINFNYTTMFHGANQES